MWASIRRAAVVARAYARRPPRSLKIRMRKPRAETLLVGPNIDISRGLQVISAQSHQLGAAAAPKRFEHVQVVAFDALQVCGNRVRPRPNAVGLLRELLDRFDEVGIAAEAEQGTMEFQVAVEHGPEIGGRHRPAMNSLDRLEPLDIGSRHR